MTYTKQTWSDGQAGATPITAARLNYIEAGIEQVAGVVMTKAQRVALSGMTTGYRVYESDTGFRLTYDGTRFRYDGDRVAVATIAARDLLTPYDNLLAFVQSSTQADGGEWVYNSGTSSWIKLHTWNYLLYSTSYSSSLPLTGTPAAIPSGVYNVTTPAGRIVDAEFHCPRWGIGSASTAFIRMYGNPSSNILDGAEYSTATGVGIAIPVKLFGQWVGTGAAVPLGVQYWCSAGSSDIQSSGTSGSPIYIRYKVR
jgi:hypothetical protein